MRKSIFGWIWGSIAFVFLLISFYSTHMGSELDKQLQSNQESLLRLQQEKYLLNKEIGGLDSKKQAVLIENKESLLDKLVQDEFAVQTAGLGLQDLKNDFTTFQSYMAGAGLFLTIAAIAITYSLSSKPKNKSNQLEERRLVSGQGIYIPANQEQLARDINHEVEKYLKESGKK